MHMTGEVMVNDLKAIKQLFISKNDGAYPACLDYAIAEFEKKQPAVWIREKIDKTHYKYTCSGCGTVTRYRKTIYCHHCGRRMTEATG